MLPTSAVTPVRLFVRTAFLMAAFVGDVRAQLAERAAQTILAAPASANAVWPGFSLPDRSWVIVDSRGALLVTSTAAPPLFAQLALAGVPATLRSRVFFKNGALPELAGPIDNWFAIGDGNGTAVTAREDLAGTVAFLYHEAFHTFQRTSFSGDTDPASSLSGLITREYAASVEIERRALRDALKSDGRARLSLLRQAVAVRIVRNRSAPPALAAAEAAAERHEGTARYVELHTSARAFNKAAQWPRDQVVDQLTLPLRIWAGSPGERLVRGRAYATGAAIGILLDAHESGADTAWKGRVQRGAAPGEILADVASVVPADADALAGEAHNRYGYDKLLAESSPPWGTLASITEEEFLKLAPFRLIIEVSRSARASFSMRATTTAAGDDRPQGIQRPEEGLTILLELTRLVVTDSAGLTTTVTGRPVSVDTRQLAPDRQLITILLAAAPLVNGALVTAGTISELSGARVTGDGVEVAISAFATITAEHGALRIALKR